ncbi:cornifelin homolog A-like [Rana temporaria]|uniref:cornifelin homolog A-like n=1 Tax=Rana temporaria TaxID=8407 RepID=UPI001AAD0729|nr:cornifelin homolog A-like [Rana temporaria]
MSHPVTMQPQAMQAYTTSQWSSDIMNCCEDMGICLCGTFIPCILACRVASDFGECCCLPILPGTLLALRTGIRERYHIPGTICNDWVKFVFCGPCATCQMARELKARNR